MLTTDDGSDGTVSRPEVRSNSQKDNDENGHLATVSRARKRKCGDVTISIWAAE